MARGAFTLTSVWAMVMVLGASPPQAPGPRPQAPEAPQAPQAPEGFVEIPGGPFTMGADRARDPLAFDNERWSAAQGEGTVDIPPFYIGRHEVSVAEFTKFAQAGQWAVDPRALQAPPDHPVTHVSWTDALAYCRWLDAALRASLPAGYHVTLPTEAQWEKAARGADGRRYPWGSEPDRAFANFGAAGTAPVGASRCPACAYGLSDMAGNVWEWTSSPLQPYPYDESNDRANLDADALWVMRGGGFADNAQLIRTTTRGAAEPGARRVFIGFRVAIAKSPH